MLSKKLEMQLESDQHTMALTWKYSLCSKKGDSEGWGLAMRKDKKGPPVLLPSRVLPGWPREPSCSVQFLHVLLLTPPPHTNLFPLCLHTAAGDEATLCVRGADYMRSAPTCLGLPSPRLAVLGGKTIHPSSQQAGVHRSRPSISQ